MKLDIKAFALTAGLWISAVLGRAVDIATVLVDAAVAGTARLGGQWLT